MDRSRPLVVLQWLAFGALLTVSAVVREGPGSAVDMAIVWLPTGVAVAGVFLLGFRAAWVVAVATLLQRWFIGYDLGVGLTAAAGSTCEAVLGAWVLRRLGLQPGVGQLRDIGAVLAAAAIAPLGSILLSWPGRMWVWLDHDMPFYSGWDGWWRMNALAVVMVVPTALAWLGSPREALPPRSSRIAAAHAIGLIAAVVALLALLPAGIVGVMWLNVVLAGVTLFAAARIGMRGATLATLICGLVVIVATTAGHGPFAGLPRLDRYVAVQLFELGLVALPPAFAALIAERRSAEDAGRRTEALLESIARNVQDAIFRVDTDLRVVYANLALARMLGHDTADGLHGLTIADAFGDAERRAEVLARLDREGQVHDEEVLLRRADGSTLWGLVSGTAVRDASGAVVCYDGAIADITSRMALEAQVRESQKMEAVGRLAGGIAHDFNNLLTVILGYGEAIGQATRPGESIRTYADAIREAGVRAAGLTRQLLAYSRRQVLTPMVLELTDVVDQMGEMLHRLMGENVRLVVDHRSGRCWIRVDRGQLEQVLMNVAVNARDATTTGGTITISTSVEELAPTDAMPRGGGPAGPCVIIRVRDTGVGMSGEVLAHAFDPFFTTKEPGRGTGLGLATVYGIVKQSGGAVWLESSPGEGTTACIAFPRLPPPADPAVAAPRERPDAQLGHATVLVAEDEASLRTLVRRTLETAGCRVIEAANGARALAAAEHAGDTIDVVVTDVVMPVMGGRELADRMGARWPRTRYLFISGYPQGARTTQDLLKTGDAFLAKPFTPDELVSHVSALLRRDPPERADRPTA